MTSARSKEIYTLKNILFEGMNKFESMEIHY